MLSENYHVLFIDEDIFIRNILRHTLSSEFRLTAMPNGIEAMSWLEQGNEPDIIVTELKLSHLDGLELIRLVRGSTLWGHIPILVLSVMDDSATRIDCLDSGADGYMNKPFNPMEVRAKIRAILRRTQSNVPLVASY
ncbi:response regulator transcription factor [Spirosoma taeanense]|uniref:Response regulator transcription factor n=1 Tax=Spirosoma taeanense TaxID=2735870 RepID=A0A6M5Y467_9BACT|nr:response regulator transcription factor [Spirosoma taeanense]QJW88150.1 response regulator transcription factor [Spirosoma taeanense]